MGRLLPYRPGWWGRFNLALPEHQRRVEAELADTELLILDNLSTLVCGGRENDAESWDSMQAWLPRFRRRGLSVLMVHHAGRGENATRTYAFHMEALYKHRGKGQQKVTVEHVHVHQGGQAIVGTVNHPGLGGVAKIPEEQPHAEQITHAPEPEMRSALPEDREAVP